MEMKAVPVTVATDGGVYRANPSPLGGSWAYVLVDATGNWVGESGPMLPGDGVYDRKRQAWVISNNVSELAAMVFALMECPKGWYGQVISDSMITLRRITNEAPSMEGVPAWLAELVVEARKHVNIDRCAWLLVSGHPTRAELACGYSQDGDRLRPVSKYNEAVDAMCTTQMAETFKTPVEVL